MRVDHERRVDEVRLAAVDAVDVERRLRPGARVELRGCLLVEARRAGLVEQDLTARQHLRRMLLVGTERRATLSQLVGEQAVPGDERRQHLHQDVDRIQRCAAVDAGMQVARAGAHAHVEADETARREAELRLLGTRDVPVEDDARVGTALVLLEEVDDRVAADLLLAVARDPDVHGELGVLRQELRRLDERVQLALVVGDPAAVVPAVALGQLERRRLPQVDRRGRLHVVVAVDHDRRRAAVAGGGRDLPEDELALAERRHLRLAA